MRSTSLPCPPIESRYMNFFCLSLVVYIMKVVVFCVLFLSSLFCLIVYFASDKISLKHYLSDGARIFEVGERKEWLFTYRGQINIANIRFFSKLSLLRTPFSWTGHWTKLGWGGGEGSQKNWGADGGTEPIFGVTPAPPSLPTGAVPALSIYLSICCPPQQEPSEPLG